MRIRSARPLAVAVLLALGACGPGQQAGELTRSAPSATNEQSPTTDPVGPGPTSAPQDIWSFEPLSPIEAGTYFTDPDLDPSTPLRVVYEVPAEGWSMWIGAGKFADKDQTCSTDGCGNPRHVIVSITTVSNLVTQGCRDHSWADPPVGPTVDDLATALADLAPFRVTSPPEDVTIYGFSGKHLEWTVPNLPVVHEGDDTHFTECQESSLKSWVAAIDAGEPGDAFYGYTGPGYREEFWILDVEGTRLMISAGGSADSPPQDIAERQAILDSIRIEP